MISIRKHKFYWLKCFWFEDIHINSTTTPQPLKQLSSMKNVEPHLFDRNKQKVGQQGSILAVAIVAMVIENNTMATRIPSMSLIYLNWPLVWHEQ